MSKKHTTQKADTNTVCKNAQKKERIETIKTLGRYSPQFYKYMYDGGARILIDEIKWVTTHKITPDMNNYTLDADIIWTDRYARLFEKLFITGHKYSYVEIVKSDDEYEEITYEDESSERVYRPTMTAIVINHILTNYPAYNDARSFYEFILKYKDISKDVKLPKWYVMEQTKKTTGQVGKYVRTDAIRYRARLKAEEIKQRR